MKVGDLVEHTIFKDLRAGIIVKIGTCGEIAEILWPRNCETGAEQDLMRIESIFLLRLMNESR